MRFMVIIIIFLYFLSWYMNGERRNNVSYHRIIISKGLKIILNPFHKNNEFDLTSVIFEMYAHISLIIVLIFWCANIGFNYSAWMLATLVLFCGTGALSFIFDLKECKSLFSKILTYIIIFILLFVVIVLSSYLKSTPI